MNSLKTVVDRMSLLSPMESQRNAAEAPVSSNGFVREKNSFVEDFILALAICNTAVVSATKNSASLVSSIFNTQTLSRHHRYHHCYLRNHLHCNAKSNVIHGALRGQGIDECTIVGR